jgi:hypothetical protein
LVKIVDNRGQFKITLPKDIVLAKGWCSETRLRFVEDLEGNIILKTIEPGNAANGKVRKR